MESTFGARLRQRREERQVTLSTISARTKIKIGVLEALESDNLSGWPRGLFGRAYLRDYATAIGLDPETVVSEFLALHPEFAYVAPLAEEAEAAAAREAARRGAAQKFRRFVSSAFSVKPRVSAAGQPATVTDGAPPLFGEAHETEFGHQTEPTTSDDPGLPHESVPELRAAEEPDAPAPFAELEAREDSREPDVSVSVTVHQEPRSPHAAEISLAAVADICTRLARAIDWREVTTLLADAARILDAVGVIVWQWDPRATALRPSLACGYSDAVVARLPDVRTDDPNAVATAFRSGEQCIVDGEAGTEAVVVPSLGVGGCVGVLAVELRPGTRERESICAFTNILAAHLAMLLPTPEPVEA